MPGFRIEQLGEGYAVPAKVYLQHLWLIDKLGPVTSLGTLYAKELGLPKFSVETATVMGAAIDYKYAAKVKWDDVSVTFYDTKGLLTQLESWRSLVYSNETGIGKSSPPGEGYKQESKFSLVDGDGSVLVRFTLKNSWPSVIDPGKLTYTESDAKLITVTLTYDMAEFEEV